MSHGCETEFAGEPLCRFDRRIANRHARGICAIVSVSLFAYMREEDEDVRVEVDAPQLQGIGQARRVIEGKAKTEASDRNCFCPFIVDRSN